MTEIQKEKYSCSKRKKKKELGEKRAQKKLTFFRNSFFVSKESRAKYTKLQVVSKQVYLREVHEMNQKSFEAMANHINTLHIQQENLNLTKNYLK